MKTLSKQPWNSPVLSLLAICLASVSLSADEVVLSYPDKPSEELFGPLKKASPFLRTLNISETYSLRAVATYEDVAYARVYNKETKETVTIEIGGEAQSGLELVKIVEPSDPANLSGVSARISFAGEIAELKYDPEQLNPTQKRDSNGSKDGSDEKRRGPSKEERERYHSLSADKKKKLHEYIKQTVKKYPNMPREERGNLIRGAMQRLVDGRDLDAPR